MGKVIIALALLTTPAMAQMSYYNGADGQQIGSAMRVGNNTYYTDGQGNTVGSAMDVGNMRYYSDAQGNPVGSRMDVDVGGQ